MNSRINTTNVVPLTPSCINKRIKYNLIVWIIVQILPDGTYISPANDRLLYAGMTSLRAMIVGSNERSLCMAVTIAVRYSAVRRQSEIEPGYASLIYHCLIN